MDHDLIPATTACELLGITSATLYAYVSRGLLESRPGPDHRSRMYRRQDVERLAQNKRAGRGAARGAAQSLDRGLPVLETGISLIQADGPYYRGRSAVAAVREGATLEQTARLLWDSAGHDPFAASPSAWPSTVARLALDQGLPPLERTLACIPLLALEVRHSFNLAPAVRFDVAAQLLRQNAALLIGQQPASTPVHLQLAQAWVPSDADFAELVRAALVLCADHELNVSAFAARVVASTGAHLHATVCSGLAALSGPRHGGATARAYALLQAGADEVAARWARGDDLPGFGHAMYPHGDPRAAELLSMLRTHRADCPRLAQLEALIARAEEASGLRPNIDLMLAALCFLYDLPASPALVVFASGRLAGWLAHALEQQTLGKLIRPRARYVGLPPEERAASEQQRGTTEE
ncbi:citrate synthase family protein [Pseudoxanthomonas winnipegensis]|uniref:citrate synthase (unknown stereospecificity) n=1 Tax=Pseudoxanthomonas winnipegensis TaxID=2480810 RepID=A0A4Q8LUT4_9GAMM|nr:citrate synthase family protein [Pseudoxanthomonas winnipegensis]RZZ85551.1 helix-turn-helix domain-containing protein [Pseudoxanthomonas winnipegensis]TAA35797.1 helix-turn-helix domain-containing protein [Pseudoxanthomonas winnipegensis]